MLKKFLCGLVLVSTLGMISVGVAVADTTPRTWTGHSVTGGDPVPTSPDVVDAVLTVLETLL
jgi:hypothetical protein